MADNSSGNSNPSGVAPKQSNSTTLADDSETPAKKTYDTAGKDAARELAELVAADEAAKEKAADEAAKAEKAWSVAARGAKQLKSTAEATRATATAEKALADKAIAEANASLAASAQAAAEGNASALHTKVQELTKALTGEKEAHSASRTTAARVADGAAALAQDQSSQISALREKLATKTDEAVGLGATVRDLQAACGSLTEGKASDAEAHEKELSRCRSSSAAKEAELETKLKTAQGSLEGTAGEAKAAESLLRSELASLRSELKDTKAEAARSEEELQRELEASESTLAETTSAASAVEESLRADASKANHELAEARVAAKATEEGLLKELGEAKEALAATKATASSIEKTLRLEVANTTVLLAELEVKAAETAADLKVELATVKGASATARAAHAEVEATLQAEVAEVKGKLETSQLKLDSAKQGLRDIKAECEGAVEHMRESEATVSFLEEQGLKQEAEARHLDAELRESHGRELELRKRLRRGRERASELGVPAPRLTSFDPPHAKYSTRKTGATSPSDVSSSEVKLMLRGPKQHRLHAATAAHASAAPATQGIFLPYL
jgi:chemosensory pili system protein ChpA (sensor histidine kinase/response regulator)